MTEEEHGSSTQAKEQTMFKQEATLPYLHVFPARHLILHKYDRFYMVYSFLLVFHGTSTFAIACWAVLGSLDQFLSYYNFDSKKNIFEE